MKYIVSSHGKRISVGLQGCLPEVETEVNYLENFNWFHKERGKADESKRRSFASHFDDMFNGRFNFLNKAHFLRFLLWKEAWPLTFQGFTWREALKKAKKKVRELNISYEEFMRRETPSNNFYTYYFDFFKSNNY